MTDPSRPLVAESLVPEPSLSVVNRIQAKLPEMSSVMAKVAKYLMENRQAPLDLNIVELAKITGTSAATVTRFCRLLGYTGYAPMRVAIAADAARADSRDSWMADIPRPFGPDDAPADVVSTLLNAHARSLRETAAVLNLGELKNMARRIARSSHLDIYGVGGSGIMAAELKLRLYRIGINCHYWTDVHAGLASAAILNPQGVAIGISNSGRTREIVEMLQVARAQGAFTIAITNNAGSPLAEVADQIIITSVYEQFMQPDDLSVKHVQLFVLDVLYLLTSQEIFPQASTYLADSSMATSPHRHPVRMPRRPYVVGPAAETASRARGRA